MIAKTYHVDGRQVLFLRTTGDDDEEQIVIYAEPAEDSCVREYKTTFGFEQDRDKADRIFAKIDESQAQPTLAGFDELLREAENNGSVD